MEAPIIKFNSAYCNSVCGQGLIARWLMKREAERFCGRYRRGKRAGQLRGSIQWLKAVTGGLEAGYGLVKPGMIGCRLVDYDGNTLWHYAFNRDAAKAYPDFFNAISSHQY